jgi:hypothetical protein
VPAGRQSVCRRCVANSGRQRERAGVSETDSRPFFMALALVRGLFTLVAAQCPRQDSNLRTRLRRPELFPKFAQVRAFSDASSGALRHKYVTRSGLESEALSGLPVSFGHPDSYPSRCAGIPGRGRRWGA